MLRADGSGERRAGSPPGRAFAGRSGIAGVATRCEQNLLYRDRYANVDTRGDGFAILHGRKEPPALQRVEEGAIEIGVAGWLDQVDQGASVGGHLEARERDQIDAPAPKRIRDFRQRLEDSPRSHLAPAWRRRA